MSEIESLQGSQMFQLLYLKYGVVRKIDVLQFEIFF